jgi:fido (protein-threonine AMPylation protein)
VNAFHRLAFEEVFPDFAGRLRGPAPRYLPINVTFGPFRTIPHEELPAAAANLFQVVDPALAELDDVNSSAHRADLAEQSLRVAAYIHGELVRIHPFVNGNGRIARMCLNYVAWRYGYRFVNFERLEPAYMDANRAWLERRDLDPFLDILRPRWLPRTPGS